MKRILSNEWGSIQILAVVSCFVGLLALFLVLTIGNTRFLNHTAQAQSTITCSPEYNPADEGPFVWTDKGGYAFGETALIIGEGNDCGVELTLMVTRSDSTQAAYAVTTDDHGEFVYGYVIDGSIGEGVYIVDLMTGDGIEVLASTTFNALAATVTTDKSDYKPGDKVIISGFGWEPGETVTFLLQEEPNICGDRELEPVIADENGNFTTFGFEVEAHDVGITFILTAIGGSSGLTAETTFTDAVDIFKDCFDLGDTNCTDDGDDNGTVDSANAPAWTESEAGSADCDIDNEELRLNRLCSVTQTISTAGYINIHFKYLWGAQTDDDVGADGSLIVEWRVPPGGFVNVNTHALNGDSATTNPVDASLGATADNTTIEIRFRDTTAESGDFARVDDVTISGDAVCGDGLVKLGEQCDDGNTDNGDGCSSTCTTEAGYSCSGEPSICCVIIFLDCFDLGSGDTNCSDDSDDSDNVDSNNAPAWTEVGDSGGNDCAIRNEELRLRDTCAVTQTMISTAGFTNIRLRYLWGADIDTPGSGGGDGDDGNLVVDWRVASGSFMNVNTHDLTGDSPTTNSEDESLGATANNTTIEIRFNGDTPEEDDQAFVDNPLVCGDPCEATCGNGVVEECEACDDGNTMNGDCCSSTCQLDAAGTACGSSANTDCDNPDTCNASGVCQINNEPNGTACTSDGMECTNDQCSGGVCAHPNKAAGTACGSNANTDCDNPDTCNASGVCLTNNEADGTACTSDGMECTNDQCNAGVCAHPNKAAGTACGSSANTDCDNPDTCNASGVCLTNNEANGFACTSDGIECTNDQCSAGVCAHPSKASGTACGSSDSTDCNAPDTCDGGVTCVDRKDPAGTVCLPGTGTCDPNDTCNGVSNACTPIFAPGGTACGSSSDTNCDNPDSCNGSGSCQVNNEPNGTTCSDGQNCTLNDACSGGVCSGTQVTCLGYNANICGNSAKNKIYGTLGPDVINGLGGDDEIHGVSGNDIICGGDGNDKLFGESGNDKMDGGNGILDACNGGSNTVSPPWDTATNCEILVQIP